MNIHNLNDLTIHASTLTKKEAGEQVANAMYFSVLHWTRWHVKNWFGRKAAKLRKLSVSCER